MRIFKAASTCVVIQLFLIFCLVTARPTAHGPVDFMALETRPAGDLTPHDAAGNALQSRYFMTTQLINIPFQAANAILYDCARHGGHIDCGAIIQYMLAMSGIFSAKYIYAYMRYDLPELEMKRKLLALQLADAETQHQILSVTLQKNQHELRDLQTKAARESEKYDHERFMESHARKLKRIESLKTDWEYWAEREVRTLKETIGKDDESRMAKWKKVEEKLAAAKAEDVKDLKWEEQRAFEESLKDFKKGLQMSTESKDEKSVIRGAAEAIGNLATLKGVFSGTTTSPDQFEYDLSRLEDGLYHEKEKSRKRQGSWDDLPRLIADSCREESCHRVWYSNDRSQMRKRSLASDVTHKLYFTPNDHEFAPQPQRRDPLSANTECRDQQTFSTSQGDLYVMTAWRGGPDSDALDGIAHQSVQTLFTKMAESMQKSNEEAKTKQKRSNGLSSFAIMGKECLSLDDQSGGEPALWGLMQAVKDPAKLEDDLDADFAACKKKIENARKKVSNKAGKKN